MPIYEYLCHDCAYRFELKQSMKQEPVATCSKCGRSVGRIISAPAIMFKGSGWYITDYSDKMKPPTDDSSAPAAGEKKEPAQTPAATTTPASSATPASSSSGDGTSSSSSTPASGSTPDST